MAVIVVVVAVLVLTVPVVLAVGALTEGGETSDDETE